MIIIRHFGDITKLHGDSLPIVDIITGGSPCQDLSVAGKRAGLAGERSGLFMEQIRIVKEMREHDRSIRGSDVDIRSLSPRFLVWENVPGALSSGNPKGEDFRIVLEEIARVCEKDAVIPGPPKEGWHSSGCILGNGYSIAWRITDTQYWGRTIRDSDTGNVLRMGTPQRRRRISLVADFGGGAAPDILFEKVLSVGESLSGDTEQSGTQRKGTAGNFAEGTGESE